LNLGLGPNLDGDVAFSGVEPDREARVSSPETSSQAPARERKVVLVVDDEALVRMLAVDMFEDLGCEVLEAGSGPEALDRLSERPDVSLMFTDCRMPGMSGPELAEEASRRWPGLRIVLVTGYHNMQSSAWPLVWKPFDARKIEQVITKQD
jgi:CheY-like chemotaxis protein